MAKWDYTLDKGRELRELINEQKQTVEQVILINKKLVECIDEIRLIVTPDILDSYEDEIDELLGNLEMSLPDIDNEDNDYEEIEEEINFSLSEFYDLCDSLRIWIEM